MIQKKTFEHKKAQSQTSQKFSNKGEISTLKSQKQVDSSNEATTIDHQIIPSANQNGETLNSKENTNSFVQSEPIDSDFTDAYISSSEDLNDLNESAEAELSNVDGSASSIFFSPSPSIVSKEQLNKSIANFLGNTPGIHLLRAEELVDCTDSLFDDLSVDTILKAEKNSRSNWLLIGITAYRAWNNAQRLVTGSGNGAAPGEGKVNAVKDLAHDCNLQGSEITYQTLYSYIRWVRVLLESPLQKFAKSDEETIRRERTALLEQLFSLTPGIAKEAAAAFRPSEAVKLACSEQEAKKSRITKAEFKAALEASKKVDTNAGADTNVQNGGVSTPRSEIQDAMASEENVNTKPQTQSNLLGLIGSLINSEAKRTKIAPKLVKDLYVVLLRTMLSSVQDMGVEE